MTGQSTVWRLLRHNISPGQLVGYAAANLIGLAIVLTAVQFYRDVTAAWDSDDSFISRDYLIISKRVNSLVGFSDEGSTFSTDEIEDLKSQPWVREVGEFTAAEFNVSASLDFWGRGMSTALFLEAIPDEFFDVKPFGWSWEPARDGMPQPEVPIVISKDYLTLYNFGFAASRGYPQVSEATIGAIPINLSVSGRGRQSYLRGRIVGFSSRLNTFAVPEGFMTWANEHFADNTDSRPSRLILEVNTPGDPAISRYFDDHDYESAGDKADNGRAAYFLSVVTGVVIAVGVVISLLAFFILLLSIYLLLQKNRDKLRMLMMLGYTPGAVARYYYRIVATINGCILAGAVACMLSAQHLWHVPLKEIGVGSESPWMAILTGTAIMAAITAGNFYAISRNIRRTFPHPHRSSTRK